jgi:type IV pilus assembly protein PilW
MKPVTLQRQAGFTLIELMVSITIGLFLLTVVGGIYFSSSRVFSATSATTVMDENARAIFDLIGVNVRQAGFKGCADFSGTIAGDIRRRPSSGWEWYDDIANPVRGFTLTGSDSRFPGSLPDSKMLTDVLMLVGIGSQEEASVVSDNRAPTAPDAPDASIVGTITTGKHNFRPGQVLLASSCQLNGFFVMGNGSTDATITYAPEDNCDTNIGTNCALADDCDPSSGANCAGVIGPRSEIPIPHALSPGALIMPVVANAYYIADSGTPGKGRSLWNCTTENQPPRFVDCQEVVNGVENLRVSFALDTTGSGSINRYVSADTPDIDWSQVRAVKLNLLLATLPDSGTSSTGSNEYTFNGKKETPNDRRIYREYTTVFSIRNKTL